MLGTAMGSEGGEQPGCVQAGREAWLALPECGSDLCVRGRPVASRRPALQVHLNAGGTSFLGQGHSLPGTVHEMLSPGRQGQEGLSTPA